MPPEQHRVIVNTADERVPRWRVWSEAQDVMAALEISPAAQGLFNQVLKLTHWREDGWALDASWSKLGRRIGRDQGHAWRLFQEVRHLVKHTPGDGHFVSTFLVRHDRIFRLYTWLRRRHEALRQRKASLRRRKPKRSVGARAGAKGGARQRKGGRAPAQRPFAPAQSTPYVSLGFQGFQGSSSSSSGPHPPIPDRGRGGHMDVPAAAAAALSAALMEELRRRVGADVGDLLAIIAQQGIQAEEVRDTIALFDRRRARKAIPEPGGWFRHALSKGWARKLAVKVTEQAHEAQKAAAYQERVEAFRREEQNQRDHGWRNRLDVELEMLLAKADDELEQLLDQVLQELVGWEHKLLKQLRERVTVRQLVQDPRWRRKFVNVMGGAA